MTVDIFNAFNILVSRLGILKILKGMKEPNISMKC